MDPLASSGIQMLPCQPLDSGLKEGLKACDLAGHCGIAGFRIMFIPPCILLNIPSNPLVRPEVTCPLPRNRCMQRVTEGLAEAGSEIPAWMPVNDFWHRSWGAGCLCSKAGLKSIFSKHVMSQSVVKSISHIWILWDNGLLHLLAYK